LGPITDLQMSFGSVCLHLNGYLFMPLEPVDGLKLPYQGNCLVLGSVDVEDRVSVTAQILLRVASVRLAESDVTGV
jgi:hypothetical protein